MGRKLGDVLEECIQRLHAGETVKECVVRYPDFKEELAPLLQVAATTMSAAKSVVPDPGIKGRGLNRLTSTIAAAGVPRLRWQQRLYALPRAYRVAAAGLTLAILGSILVIGTSIAAADSVPGDSLYWVKTTRENITLMMPKSNAEKAEAHVKLASVRTEEMRQLVEDNRLDDAEQVWSRIQGHLQRSASYAGIDVTAATIEMPVYQVVPLKQKDALQLKRRLVEDIDSLKVQLVSDDNWPQLGPDDLARVKLLRRRVEMRYRWFIGALERYDSPGWRPAGIVEPTSIR